MSESEEETTGGDMPFLEHLEELRWHLIRSVVAIVVFAALAFIFSGFFFGEIVMGPAKPDFITYRLFCRLGEALNSPFLCIDKLDFILQSRTMTGQFTMHITYSVVTGIICAFPYVFWELWRFIRPGLRTRERKAAEGAVIFVSLLFFSGVLFGYFLVSPLSINFLANYKLDATIMNNFDVVSYVSTLSMIVLSCGLMFQLPVVAYFMSKAEIITPKFLRKYRKHAIVIILIISAILTPPDVMSQVMVALPIFFLYELSIWLSALVWKRKRKQKAMETMA